MSMTKKEIADNLALQLNIGQSRALSIVNDFFDSIKQSLSQGEDVKLSGFGNFTLRHKSARPGRNPKTGEVVMIKPRQVVTFKAGPKLKKAMQSK